MWRMRSRRYRSTSLRRDRSMKAVEAALSTEEKLIACVTTKTENVTGDDAKYADLFEIGTIVNIKRMMRNEGIMQLIVRAFALLMSRVMGASGAESLNVARSEKTFVISVSASTALTLTRSSRAMGSSLASAPSASRSPASPKPFEATI